MYLTIFVTDWGQKTSLTKLVLKRSVLKQSLQNLLLTQFAHWLRHLSRPVEAIKLHADYARTADYAEIGEWAQLDLQSIQRRDYFGHLSISFCRPGPKNRRSSQIYGQKRQNGDQCK
jgi:hypothetical protein